MRLTFKEVTPVYTVRPARGWIKFPDVLHSRILRIILQQVDSACYRPWDDKMSTSQRAVMLCGWGVKGEAWCNLQVKLCDPCLSAFEVVTTMRYTN